MKLILLKPFGLNRAGDVITPDKVASEILIRRGIASYCSETELHAKPAKKQRKGVKK